MVVYKDINKQFFLLKTQVKDHTKKTLLLAQHLYYWYVKELFKKDIGLKYNDIYDFSKKCLDLDRKTINTYLDVVHVYFDMVMDDDDENQIITANYNLKDDYFQGFNYSQLKACLKLNLNELVLLGIDSSTSVHEIEKRKKEYLKRINNEISKTSYLEDEEKDEKEDGEFVSLHDNKKNIDILKNEFIPDNSEFEVVFRNEKTLFKGTKKKYNLVTSLKILRQMLENNSEEEFYYAVVKIKKPL